MLVKCLLLVSVSVFVYDVSGETFAEDAGSTKTNISSVEGFGPLGPLEGGEGYQPVDNQQSNNVKQAALGGFRPNLQPGVGAGGPVELHVSLHDGAGQSGAVPPFLGNRNPQVTRTRYPGQYKPTNAYQNGYPGLYNSMRNPLRFGQTGYPNYGYPSTFG